MTYTISEIFDFFVIPVTDLPEFLEELGDVIIITMK
jgi:hypothetical protein